jgi:hypothetical protein
MTCVASSDFIESRINRCDFGVERVEIFLPFQNLAVLKLEKEVI